MTPVRSQWLACLRVTIYVSAVALALCVWSARAVLAEAELSFQRFGEKLALELGPSLVGEPQTLSINGQILMVSSRQSEHSVREVLDSFDAHCGGRVDTQGAPGQPSRSDGSIPGVLTPSRPRAKPDALRRLLDRALRFGVLRHENADEGQLACFARADGQNSLSSLLNGLQDVVQTGDLSKLGDFRYVTARRHENGKTHVLTVWSEGPLRMAALLPESGDAPGTDMPDVPRPQGATRQLCAMMVGRSYALRLYQTAQKEQEVLAFYDRELPQSGWQAVPGLPDGGDLGGGTFARAFTKDGHAIAIGVEQSSLGGTGVSLIDLGAVSHAEARGQASPFD